MISLASVVNGSALLPVVKPLQFQQFFSFFYFLRFFVESMANWISFVESNVIPVTDRNGREKEHGRQPRKEDKENIKRQVKCQR